MLFTPHLWLPKAAAAAYVGPGDAVSGAYLWGGLRAYTAASIGSNAIRLHAADATEADFVTVSGGGLDLTSINSFISTHGACTVAKIYDQTGNGRDLVQATVANQATYSSTSGPSSKPGMTCNLSVAYATASAISLIPPMSMSFVAQTNPDGVHDLGLGGMQANFGGFVLQRGVSVSLPNTLELYDGNGFARVAATDNTWLAVNTWTTNSSQNGTIEVNGTQVTAFVNFGTDSTSTTFSLGNDGTRYWRGLICEAGVWPGGSTTTIDTVNGNQRTYWGF
jgi:hypothetical protein